MKDTLKANYIIYFESVNLHFKIILKQMNFKKKTVSAKLSVPCTVMSQSY